MHSKEQLTPQQNPVFELRDQRMKNAEITATDVVRGVVARFDRTDYVDGVFAGLKPTGFGRDNGFIGANDLMVFEALGENASEVVDEYGNFALDGEKFTIGGETVEFDKLGQGFSASLRIEGIAYDQADETEPDLIHEAIKNRYKASELYSNLGELKRRVTDLHDLPAEIVSDPFSLDQDPLASLVFICQDLEAGLNVSPQELKQVLEGKESMQSFLERRIASQPGRFRRSETEQGMIHYETIPPYAGDPVVRLEVEWPSASAKVAITKDPDGVYREHYSNVPGIESAPFIDTECAEEFFAAIDQVGLSLTTEYERPMIDAGKSADRYGSVYTQLSREIAKWVNSPSRAAFDNLFSSDYASAEQTNHYDEIRGSQRERAKHALRRLDTEGLGEPATLLLSLIKQVALREEHNPPSDLPVTDRNISMKDGACFDVASYYIGAAAGRGVIGEVSHGGKEFLEKNYGSHTFLSREEVVFNGIRLPKGSLFKQEDDGSWAFLRLTPFAFDDPHDQEVFGTEVAAITKSFPEEVAYIGGTALGNLSPQVAAVY